MILDIKRAAKLRGISVKELADKLHVASPTLSQHINGNPSVKVLQGIASAMGCNITDLFFAEEGEETPSAKLVCPHCGKPLNIHID